MEMAGRILTVMLLSGNDRKTVYQDFQKEGQSCHLQAAGYRIDIRDRAEVKNGVMRFCTAVSGKRMEPAAETEKNRQNTGFAEQSAETARLHMQNVKNENREKNL